jgi:hypothetical protein
MAIVHPSNRRLLKHLSKERGHLFAFLRRIELAIPRFSATSADCQFDRHTERI